MTETYRQRATKAEQENAQLKERLAKQPNHQWFVDLVRKHLGQAADVHPSKLAFQVKQLKEARGQGLERHNQTREALKDLWQIVNNSDDETCMCGGHRDGHGSPITEGHNFTPMLSHHLHGWRKQYPEIAKEVTGEDFYDAQYGVPYAPTPEKEDDQ